MSLDAFLAAQLAALQARGLFRDPADATARQRVEATAGQLGVPFLDASSNDYLGLARRPGDVSRETSVQGSRTTPVGAAASRLVHGTHAEHEKLEHELAVWVGTPAALVFTSGFAANVGAVGALAAKPFGLGTDESAAIISDALNHASLIDGTRLARGTVTVVPHRSLAAVEAALAGHRGAPTRWVVTESYFSMDGDTANLAALRALCDRHRAFLVVDEAHALGVFGPRGAGLCANAGVRPDVLIGTFGKALGTQGAFVAGSEVLRTFLWNRARSFVFSTAMSPVLAAETRENLRIVQNSDARRAILHENCARIRTLLEQRGVPVLRDSVGPIVAVPAGSNARAIAMANRLRNDGVLAQAIRSPTVPEGLERLRITITSAFSETDVARLGESLERAWRETL